jgi:hypothetical protein
LREGDQIIANAVKAEEPAIVNLVVTRVDEGAVGVGRTAR